MRFPELDTLSIHMSFFQPERAGEGSPARHIEKITAR